LLKPYTGMKKSLELRERGGLWLGKILAAAARASGQGGTTLPGRAALSLAPHLLSSLAGQLRRGSLLVTGTNGKTTTAYLLANILRQSGFRVLHNSSGSNLAWGIASSLIDAGSWRGTLPYDLGILEVDEGAFPRLVKALQPKGAVITNIFSDQLDRYGAVARIRAIIGQGLESLPEGCPVILNADDPSAVCLTQQHRLRPVYFGFSLKLPGMHLGDPGGELPPCPRCGQRLSYRAVYLAHLGLYRCLFCKLCRPEPQIRLTRCEPSPAGGAAITIALPGQQIKINFSLPGTYNLYNALAAAACASAWRLPAEQIATGLEEAVPSWGRMERLEIGGRTVMISLVKNAAGANEVLRTFLEQPARFSLLIAINDRYGDGTDISWLWDIDFERIAAVRQHLGAVIASGSRAADVGVRLKYAGLEPALFTVEPSLKRALKQIMRQGQDEEPVYILPSYTAMLSLRRMLGSMRAAVPELPGRNRG